MRVLKGDYLFMDGQWFYMNRSSREDADRMAESLSGTARDYSIHVSEKEPSTGEVTKWEEREGFSVWVNKRPDLDEDLPDLSDYGISLSEALS